MSTVHLAMIDPNQSQVIQGERITSVCGKPGLKADEFKSVTCPTCLAITWFDRNRSEIEQLLDSIDDLRIQLQKIERDGTLALEHLPSRTRWLRNHMNQMDDFGDFIGNLYTQDIRYQMGI